MMKKILGLLVLGILMLSAYFLFYPVPIDPAGWTPPELPVAEGVYAPNEALQTGEIIAQGNVGPEAVVFDSEGRLHTGLDNGNIIRLTLSTNEQEILATVEEPLGMAFDSQGNLVVADATLGLLSIAPDGEITTLLDALNDDRFFYINDLDVDENDVVYFTHASTKWNKVQFTEEVIEHRPYGSVWSYDLTTSEATLLVDNLHFSNGLTLGENDDYIVFVELLEYRVHRHWLRGDDAGETQIFIENVPGFPDNITYDGNDTFWLALASGPDSRTSIDGLLPNPFLLRVIYRLPEFLRPAPDTHGYVLGFDLEGTIIYNLQDPVGELYFMTTSAMEYEGNLYIGSIIMDGILRVPVPEERFE